MRTAHHAFLGTTWGGCPTYSQELSEAVPHGPVATGKAWKADQGTASRASANDVDAAVGARRAVP